MLPVIEADRPPVAPGRSCYGLANRTHAFQVGTELSLMSCVYAESPVFDFRRQHHRPLLITEGASSYANCCFPYIFSDLQWLFEGISSTLKD